MFFVRKKGIAFKVPWTRVYIVVALVLIATIHMNIVSPSLNSMIYLAFAIIGSVGTVLGYRKLESKYKEDRSKPAIIAEYPRPKFCLQCGKPLRPESKFCLECGAPTKKR